MIDQNAQASTNPLQYEDGLNRFIPPIIDRRMASQQGVFTIQKDPFEIISDGNLSEILIKGGDKASIRKQLHRLGMNQASLFPDVSGLSANLKWVWEHYRGA
jgi:hypothetical protein